MTFKRCADPKCGKLFPLTQPRHIYCSKRCSWRIKSWNSHSKHRTGSPWLATSGYWTQHVVGRGSIYVHRLVVERKLGRKLKRNEIVHHRDGNKTNNSIRNLEIATPRAHILMHGKIALKNDKCLVCSAPHMAYGLCSPHWIKVKSAIINCVLPRLRKERVAYVVKLARSL